MQTMTSLYSTTSVHISAGTLLEESTKSLFKQDISPRRISYIQTLADLLNVLDAQNILTRPNVDQLKRHLPDNCGTFIEERFLQLTQTIIGTIADSNERNSYADMCCLERLESNHLRRPQQHAIPYSGRRVGEDIGCSSSSSSYSHSNSNEPADGYLRRIPQHHAYQHDDRAQYQLYKNKRPGIYRLVAEEIGHKWRDLGRELGVAEGKLDRIDDAHRGNSANKLHAVLACFEERVPAVGQQYQLLMAALRHVRRADLARSVEDYIVEQMF